VSVNGRMREDTLARSLQLFEYSWDILGLTGTKPGFDGCESGAGTVSCKPPLPASHKYATRLTSKMQRAFRSLQQRERVRCKWLPL
jgi:hypothetical protein